MLETGVISGTTDPWFFIFTLQTEFPSSVCRCVFILVWVFCSFQATFVCFLVHVSGVCVKDRWRELLHVTQPHTDDHMTVFNDLHFLMASLGAKESGTSQRLLEGLQDLAKWVLHHVLPLLHTSTLLSVLRKGCSYRPYVKTETETRLERRMLRQRAHAVRENSELQSASETWVFPLQQMHQQLLPLWSFAASDHRHSALSISSSAHSNAAF